MLAPGDTINFNTAGVFASPQMITLTSGELLIKNLMINGSGKDNLTVSGNNAVRVFEIASGVTATLSGMTIANGVGGA